MQYNDDNLISDEKALEYNMEFNSAIERFHKFHENILALNVLNMGSNIVALLKEQLDLLKNIQSRLDHNRKLLINEHIIKTAEHIDSLGVLYDKEFNVKTNSNLPILRQSLEIENSIIKSMIELGNYELNDKIKIVVEKFLFERLDVDKFLVSLII